MDQIKTGNIIRTMRLRQGMTQRELAEKIGVSDIYGSDDMIVQVALS